MRALSLNQPSASAIAAGAKAYETRGWAPPSSAVGTRIAIHAAKVKPSNRQLGELIDHLARTERLHRIWLEREGYVSIPERFVYETHPERMPRGVIIATAVIARVVPTTTIADHVTDAEWAVGDYSPNRFAWRLEDLVRLETPVEAKGALSLFDLDEDVVKRVEASSR